MAEPRSAVETALRVLRHRDMSVHELERRLAERGFSGRAQEEAVAALARTGLLDDARFAEGRARSLAERGAGDRLISHALTEAGVSPEIVHSVLAALPPEDERARRVVARRGASPRTVRYLQAKGFGEEAVARAVAGGPDEELG